MRNKTQERIEELARERAAAAIDLALVEEGIEIGKQMMAEMIATYPHRARARRRDAGPRALAAATPRHAATSASERASSATASGYLNEVSALTARECVRRRREADRGMTCRRTASAARTTSRCSSTR